MPLSLSRNNLFLPLGGWNSDLVVHPYIIFGWAVDHTSLFTLDSGSACLCCCGKGARHYAAVLRGWLNKDVTMYISSPNDLSLLYPSLNGHGSQTLFPVQHVSIPQTNLC